MECIEHLTGVHKLKPIAQNVGCTMGQLAIAWVQHNPNVAGAIVGASRPEQLVENVKATDVYLDESTLAAVDSAIGHLVTDDPSKVAVPEGRSA